MMVFIVSLMGMAVDAGVLFAIRGRLSSAVDSAALAAGRGVSLGSSSADANAKATQAALRFLNANFPDNYLGIDPTQTNLTADFALSMQANRPTGLLQISVRAEVAAPVYFMKFWGIPKVPISVEGKASRRNLVLIMVLDKSSSMGSRSSAVGTLPTTLASNATSCEGMVFAAGQMPDYFSPYDNIGMVSFDYTAYKDFPASTNFKGTGSGTLKDKISRISCGNNTNTTAALQAAYEEIQRIDQKLAVNVVMLFTDGAPNGINAGFPLRTSVDTRLGPADVPDTHPDVSNCRDSSGTKTCTNMTVVCATGNVQGVITQTAGFALQSGSRGGLFKAFSGDTLPSFPSSCPNSGTKMTSQSLAYIPDTDRFGNSTHGPKDNWVFQVNQQCAPDNVAITPGNSRCKNVGGYWSDFTGEWTGKASGSNFFTAGPYSNKFRPDQANTIGVVSMNSAINQAIRMRNDANYGIRIDSIYLQGNGGDPVDRDFLPMVSNLKLIPALIYQPAGTADTTNPLYNPGQTEGFYTQSVNVQELGSIFAEVASSLLRLSQ
jgi:Flp pilus assembly protein TadG